MATRNTCYHGLITVQRLVSDQSQRGSLSPTSPRILLPYLTSDPSPPTSPHIVLLSPTSHRTPFPLPHLGPHSPYLTSDLGGSLGPLSPTSPQTDPYHKNSCYCCTTTIQDVHEGFSFTWRIFPLLLNS
ncbi:hypothetical protein Pcinc_042978 [Petrolisthes cinctipes]|uniref:Uncharacterized protein n=1 Tax=Petrolisthes cinctipes TaxID=88211 RepID=A0AAE1BGL8_PETCI|nr:hypothetical protein Pcinc_042978 [Petrolisthes cinctipes]